MSQKRNLQSVSREGRRKGCRSTGRRHDNALTRKKGKEKEDSGYNSHSAKKVKEDSHLVDYVEEGGKQFNIRGRTKERHLVDC